MCGKTVAASVAELRGVSGSAIWAIPTMMIKPLTALWFTNKQEKLFNRHNLIGVLIAGAVSIVGYYLAEVILVGSWTAPLLTIWGNVVQAVGSGILFVVMSFAIDRVSLKKKLQIH